MFAILVYYFVIYARNDRGVVFWQKSILIKVSILFPGYYIHLKTMTITVTDFERITGISRHTVYSWIYRDKMPEGIEIAPSLGSTKMLIVRKDSKHFEKIKKQLV